MPLTPYTNTEAPKLRGAANLAKRIEKAIAENTCPYTTEADIRYFETEEFESAWKEITWSWSPEMSLILLFSLTTTPAKYGMI